MRRPTPPLRLPLPVVLAAVAALTGGCGASGTSAPGAEADDERPPRGLTAVTQPPVPDESLTPASPEPSPSPWPSPRPPRPGGETPGPAASPGVGLPPTADPGPPSPPGLRVPLSPGEPDLACDLARGHVPPQLEAMCRDTVRGEVR